MFICFEIQPLADSGGTPRANHASLRYLAAVRLQTCGGESELALVRGEMRFTLTLFQASSAVHSFSWPLLTGLAPVAPGNRAWGMGVGGSLCGHPFTTIFIHFYSLLSCGLEAYMRRMAPRPRGGFSQQRGTDTRAPCVPTPLFLRISVQEWGQPRSSHPGAHRREACSWGPPDCRLCFVILIPKSSALGRSMTR